MTNNLQFVKKLDVFDCDKVGDFIAEFVDRAGASGLSFREMSKLCGFSAPNYFQRVVTEKRSISVAAASKIAEALEFSDLQKEYFIVLAKLELPKYKDKNQLQTEAKNLKNRANKSLTHATEIHENWLHSVIFEMAMLKGFIMSAQNILASLKRSASIEEIQKSLDFLQRHKWLVPTDEKDVFNQAMVEFDPKYDRRAVDMLTVHRQHLDMAKHRLNDAATETEFLGLTTAIPFKKMPEVQQILRDAMDQIEYKVAGSGDADNVIIVHMSAFKVLDTV
ncbi:TIGR02147 family protein [Oligoflexaceae bacterium]|nr:TIGR02147 family protein [Oligoflexaceae bacterium]